MTGFLFGICKHYSKLEVWSECIDLRSGVELKRAFLNSHGPYFPFEASIMHWVEMANKLLRSAVVVFLFRIDWKKLFFIGSIATMCSLVIQDSKLPYPLTDFWIFSPPTAVLSFKHIDDQTNLTENSGTNLTKTLPLARKEKSEIVPDVHVKNVLVNSSAGINNSVVVPREEKKVPPRRRKGRRSKPIDMIIPPSPPALRTIPSRMLRRISSLSPVEALVLARQDIDNAPLISDDPELHAPLFRNVSTFRRSYELMEHILKVYIYQDGERPIFHEPHLTGIYSSEGWFMKLIENSRQFVTKDPEKAHLFYLPYSARQLQMALYVPNSHNLRPLAIFLRDYVNTLAAKYPFWNRTHGSDHFLVACHDWGPYTLKEHEELVKNTIKALCNADISEGFFLPGRDVSLPETTIRIPKRPRRNVGGKRVSQRSILAFFAGHMHGRVRPILLKYWSDKDEDMRIYGPLPNRVSRKMSYPEHMKSSKYCICPMGYEVNSPRIVEAIYYECVPVIIADNFAPPLSDVLDWNAFSVTVAEKDIPKLKDILLAIPLKRYLAMQTNVKMLQKHFLWNAKPIRFDMFHMILHSLWWNRLNQIQTPRSS